MRNSARKQLGNHSIKSRLHTLEKNFVASLATGKKDVAAASLKTLVSAFDKAAKTGVIHRSMASRKKSRLTLRLNAVK